MVASVMRLLDIMRMVVIRATPQSIFLQLLDHHVLRDQRDLEPVYFEWKTLDQRKRLPYKEYLECGKSSWQEKNAKYRPHNPEAKTLYLIDEGQKSYEEEDFLG